MAPSHRFRPVCAACGYDLSGMPRAFGEGMCPECGTPFDPRRPSTIQLWPRRWRLAVCMTWPAWALVGAGGVISIVGVKFDWLMWWVGPLWAGGCVWAVVFYPPLVAWTWGQRHALPTRRSQVVLASALGGIAANLAIVVLGAALIAAARLML